MKQLFSCICLLLINNLLPAQVAPSSNLMGKITEAQTHQPVAYATIELLKADSSRVKGALANENGTFHFDGVKIGHYIISIKALGYATKKMSVSIVEGANIQDIGISRQSKELQEVSIRATKPLIENKNDRIIMNVENSVVAAGNNVLELIKMAPLVKLDQNDKITLKGKTNVLIMLDGKALPGETLGAVMQNISAEQVAKIELITNPSAKYDASASGGIINIITRKGTDMGLNGTATIGASRSSYNRFNTGLTMNYRTKKLNVYGNIYYRDGKSSKNETLTRFLSSGTDQQTLETPSILRGHSTSESGKIGIDYNPNKTTVIGFAFDGIFSQVSNNLKATSNFSSGGQSSDSTLKSTSNPKNNIKFTSYNLNYKNTLDTTGEELLINLTHSRFDGLNRQDLFAEMRRASVDPSLQSYNSSNRTVSLFNITTFQTDYTHPFNKNTSLELGLKESYTASRNESSNIGNNFINDTTGISRTRYTENVIAGYLNLSKQLRRLKIQAGLRAEQTNAQLTTNNYKSSYLNLFPSAGIEESFSDHYQISLTYSRKISRPDYESLIPFIIPIDRYSEEKGNPNLKPEYSNSFELTNTYKNISITLGYTRTNQAITDFINQNLQTNVWSFTKANFDKMENFSIALNIPLTITKWWDVSNSVFGTHISYYDKNIGGETFDQAAYSASISSINSFSLPDQIKAEVTGNYNSPSLSGLYHISHNYQINAGISKLFINNLARVRLGINDIFHSAGYKINTDFGSLRFNGSSYTDSRRVTLSLSYKFGKKIPPAPEKINGSENEKNRLSL
jgi:outer membrane cobalamin receptor